MYPRAAPEADQVRRAGVDTARYLRRRDGALGAADRLLAGGALTVGGAVILVCYLAVRHWCRAADGHPMLPAVITIGYAVLSVGWYLYGGPTPGVPVVADRVLALGGLAALVCLSVIELVVLHNRGITLAGPPACHVADPWADLPLPAPPMPPGVILRPH
jgi:hypothetical protein